MDDRWAVSIKGVLGWHDRFVVLRNPRDEWELPGGRLDATDSGPTAALHREILEELGLEVDVGPPIDSWIYHVDDKQVLILVYICTGLEPAELSHSEEHSSVAAMPLAELESSRIPPQYVNSIQRARKHVAWTDVDR
jgi:8-oxo-dGTP pyrophosphatase MutT (NUDIX family)